jgi:hypothetical protein
MKHIALAAALTLALGGAAFAQSSMSAPDNSANSATNPQKMPGMAATSSDSGRIGTGASSAALGTGNTQTHGVMSPTAPASSGTGATGANPNNPGGVSNNQ